MNMIAQIAMTDFPPAMKVAVVVGGVLALVVAMKVGQVIIRLFFGLIGLALLGGAAWYFLIRH